jgi:hypothetical protein
LSNFFLQKDNNKSIEIRQNEKRVQKEQCKNNTLAALTLIILFSKMWEISRKNANFFQ